jgi:putative ABC transport system permease protein
MMRFVRHISRALTRRARLERELEDELESFVELLAREKEAGGTDPAEARRQAVLELGGKEPVKERVRDLRTGEPFRVFFRDLAFGFRLIARSPAFTALAVGTLALGIGAATAVFSVAHAVLFSSLPYPDSERLVYLWTRSSHGQRPFSPPDYVELREQLASFEELAAIQGDGLVTLLVDGRPEPVRMREVTPNFLATYGVEPHLGRGFRPADDVPVDFEAWGNPDAPLPEGVLLLSYELFRDRFGADRRIVGARVDLEYQPYRIVGVTPPGFRTLVPDDDDYTRDADVWSLSRMDFPRMPRDVPFLRVVGRLRDGASLENAQAEADLFAGRQRSLHPIHRESRLEIEVVSLRSALSEGHATRIWILLGAVSLVLLIGCVNLVNLLLSRSAARQKELALRTALGAGRGRLVRQMLTESLLYGALGAAGGLVLCRLLIELFSRRMPSSLPRADEIGIDGRVLAFSIGLAVLSALLVALVPALRFTGAKSLSGLRAAARGAGALGAGKWDGILVVGEVALSVTLVIGTALLLRSLSALLQVDPGFDPNHVLTAEMALSSRRYPRYPQPDARVRFARVLSERVEEIPSVESAALALVVPLSRQDTGHSYATESIAATSTVYPPAKYRPVTPGYFDAAGTRLLSGRDFDWSDLEGRRLVTVVDEKLAMKAWAGESAIGKRLRIEVWSTAEGPIRLAPLWTEVIGIVENVKSAALDRDDLETIYVPYSLYAVSELSLLVRSREEPAVLTSAVREAVAAIDPDLAVFHFRVMDEWVVESVAPRRFSLTLLSGFGAAGFALALLGIYGVLSSMVSLSRRELSIRMALGAPPGRVLRSVMVRGVRLTGVGLLLGLAAASVLARLVSSELYDVGPTDVSVYAAVSILTLSVGAGACFLPARRAARIDPMSVLKLE